MLFFIISDLVEHLSTVTEREIFIAQMLEKIKNVSSTQPFTNPKFQTILVFVLAAHQYNQPYCMMYY